jgi:hypothetical protein
VRIKTLIPYVQDKVVAVTNNKFINPKIYLRTTYLTFASADNPTITLDDPAFDFSGIGFANGDDIAVIGTVKNNGIYQISTVGTDVLTLTVDASGVIKDEDPLNDYDYTWSDMFIYYVLFPRAIKPAVANMIRYDMLDRMNRSGVQSETIGNYSVSYMRAAELGYDYPADIISGLDPWCIPAVG